MDEGTMRITVFGASGGRVSRDHVAGCRSQMRIEATSMVPW